MDQTIELTHGMTNVFPIENPERYACRLLLGSNDVMSYGMIWLHGPDGLQVNLYISLSIIRYFQGTLFWRVANFTTATETERDDLLSQIGLNKPGQFSSDLYLLKSETREGLIRLLIGSAFLSTDIPQYHQTHDENLIQRVTIRPQDGEPFILKYQERLGQTVPYSSSTVKQVIEKFEEGYTHPQILAMMPWLEVEDIQACLIYARQAVQKRHEQD